jgi:hypothetical protein
VDVDEDEDDDSTGLTVPFGELVAGRPPWDVCRLFLSTLILTNNGNVDIQDYDTNKFSLKLVDPRKSLAYAVEANSIPATAIPTFQANQVLADAPAALPAAEPPAQPKSKSRAKPKSKAAAGKSKPTRKRNRSWSGSEPSADYDEEFAPSSEENELSE